MNRGTLFAGLAAMLLPGLAAARPDAKPADAASILNAAYKESKASRKPIFLVFDASW